MKIEKGYKLCLSKEKGKTKIEITRHKNPVMDNFLIKHPLLGKITLRELCYFTIYHTQHHIKIITTLTQEKNDSIF